MEYDGYGWCLKFVVNSPSTMPQAKSKCAEEGTQLAIIDTNDKKNIVIKKVSNDYPGK